MPTYDEDSRFWVDWSRLTSAQQQDFLATVPKFVADLVAGRFRKGLRAKRVQGHPGVWEMTWADDGRATFHYGASILAGEPHVVWRRIGGHDILDEP